MILFLLLVLPLASQEERVDTIELNEVYYVHPGDEFADPELRVHLRQFIFWSLEGDKYVVRDFLVLKNDRYHVVKNGFYELRIYRRKKKYLITAPAYINTFTDYDVEIKERETLPKHKRREIFK